MNPYRASILFLAALATLACVAPATADGTDIDVTGEVRVRSEVDSRSFVPDAAMQQYTDLRARLALLAVVDQNVAAFIQLQDSRRLGGATDFGLPASGGLNDGSNVDVHQAFLKVKHLWDGGPGLKAGRFEVNLGNQRVFGAVGWHNVGRSWEGLQAWHAFSEDVKAAAYWLKAMELNSSVENQDFDILGTNVWVKNLGLELFAFLEHDAAMVAEDVNALDRIDLGMYYKRLSGQLDYEVNAVFQTGTQAFGSGTGAVEQDIAAYLITGEVGYRFPGEKKARVAAGIDLASGDDDTSDNDFKTYDNLYYTGHKFRGYMDYFLGSGVEGLMDLMARGSFQPAEGWVLKGDLHYFMTAQDYTDFQGDETKSVGVEVDLGVATTRVPGVTISGGAALFVPSESWAGTEDKEAGLWFYGQMQAGFGGK